MTTATRSLLKSLLEIDEALTQAERHTLQCLITGKSESATTGAVIRARVFITQSEAAALLAVSRQTVWRHTKTEILTQYQVLPDVWRYDYDEIVARGRKGLPESSQPNAPEKLAA